MTDFKLYFLGRPRIMNGEREIRISRRKSMALLSLVASSYASRISRSRISELLWPNQDETHSRGALRTALSTLNSEPGKILVVSEGDYIHLQENIWVDVNDFREKVQKMKHSDFFSTGLIEKLTEAAALYTADFMSGFSAGRGAAEFENWQFRERENLRVLYSSVLERLVQSFTLTSKLEKAIDFARLWTLHEPENEHAHRRLIELYGWTGKKHEALHQYEQCESILKRDLDIEPEESTRKLYDSIRENRLKIPSVSGEGNPEIPAASLNGSSVYYSAVLSAGLTNSAEKLLEQRPYDTASIVNIIFNKTVEEILVKQSADYWLIVGDTITALFGIPNAAGDDAYRAVISAIEILQTAGSYGFTMTAGISMGLVYTGSDDSASRNSSLIGPGVTQANLLRFFGDPGNIFVEGAASSAIGRVNLKMHPFPSADSSLIVPPCISTSFFVIGSPSPVPPYSRLGEESA